MNKELLKECVNWCEPKHPLQREITKEEHEKLLKLFPTYSHSMYVDADGRIIIGNGIDVGGRYYITPEDLAKIIL